MEATGELCVGARIEPASEVEASLRRSWNESVAESHFAIDIILERSVVYRERTSEPESEEGDPLKDDPRRIRGSAHLKATADLRVSTDEKSFRFSILILIKTTDKELPPEGTLYGGEDKAVERGDPIEALLFSGEVE